MAKIKFITDSAADIPQKYVDAYNITVIRFPVILEDREVLDGAEFTPDEFYALLRKVEKIPSHAQLNAYQLEEVYEQTFAEGYDGVIYTCINFKGSGTGESALAAKKSFFAAHPEAEGRFEIHVLDSKCYTYAYGYPIVETAKLAQDGCMTVQQAVDKIQDWIDHCKILFTMFDLRFARKSGRVSAAAAILGGAMGIRPVMTFEDGENKILAKPRGDAKVIKTMTDMMLQEMEPGSPYLVINAGMEDKNQEMQKAALAAAGYDPAEIFKVGGVIAINAGPELVGVIYRKKD